MLSRCFSSSTDPLQPLQASNRIIFTDGRCSNKVETREVPPLFFDRALLVLLSDSVTAPFELPLQAALLSKGIRRLADAVSRRITAADLESVPAAVQDRFLALLAEAAETGSDHMSLFILLASLLIFVGPTYHGSHHRTSHDYYIWLDGERY